MEEEEEMTPFWLQQPIHGSRARGGARSQISSTFMNSGLFLIVSVISIASVLIFIIIPSIMDFTSQILKPQSVKKSWDSLNLVLVLFAIVCGFLNRNTIQNSSSSYNTIQQQEDRQKSNPSTPRRWNYEYGQDRPAYYTSSAISLSRLTSFRSYPDFRQESIWMGSSDERWRFYDDTHLRNYNQVPNPDQIFQKFHWDHPRQQLDQDQETKEEAKPEAVVTNTKDIALDTFVTNPNEVKDSYFSPPKSTPLPPPDPPEKAGKRKVKRAPRKEVQVPIFIPATEPEKAGKRNVKRAYHDLGSEEVHVSIFTPPPPPPMTSGKSEKKRGKDILNSIRGKKKQRQKSVDNLEAFFDQLQMSSSIPPPSSPHPPPPPPPPPFFQNLFSSKKSKAKKKTCKVPPSSPTPPLATTSSPLRPIPPPPPPFKMPAWKFVVEGETSWWGVSVVPGVGRRIWTARTTLFRIGNRRWPGRRRRKRRCSGRAWMLIRRRIISLPGLGLGLSWRRLTLLREAQA